MNVSKTPDFLNNIPNSAIEGHALVTLSNIKSALLKTFGEKHGLDEGSSISDMIISLDKSGIEFDKITDCTGLSYILCADLICSMDDTDIMNPSEGSFHLNKYLIQDINNQIVNNGVSCIWNSLTIKDEALKIESTNRILEKACLHNTFFYEDEGEIDERDIILEIIRSYIGYIRDPMESEDSEEYVIHDYSQLLSQNILISDAGENWIKGLTTSFLEYISEGAESEIIFNLVSTLCQTAYMQNMDPKLILDGAVPIIESVIESLWIDIDAENMEKLKRRTLIHASMGFQGMMNELSPTKEDILYINSHYTYDDIMPDISASPFSRISFPGTPILDQCEDIYFNYLNTLKMAGLYVDINDALKIDAGLLERSFFGDILISGLHISFSNNRSQDIIELTGHPAWLEDKKASLFFSRSIPSDDKINITMEIIQNMVGKKKTANYFPPHKSKLKKDYMNTNERLSLLDKMIENNILNPETAECAGITEKELLSRKKDLPPKMKHYLLSRELGI